MIKPCAKARLLGQTRKPNTDWKPNYGLLTRSAWMFRGNPWESVGHGKWLPCEFHCPLSCCPYRCDGCHDHILSKCGYSWIFNCAQNAVMAKIIDAQVACSIGVCFFLYQQGSECGHLARRDPILLDATGQAKAPPFDSATALGAGHGDNP